MIYSPNYSDYLFTVRCNVNMTLLQSNCLIILYLHSSWYLPSPYLFTVNMEAPWSSVHLQLQSGLFIDSKMYIFGLAESEYLRPLQDSLEMIKAGKHSHNISWKA